MFGNLIYARHFEGDIRNLLVTLDICIAFKSSPCFQLERQQKMYMFFETILYIYKCLD